jgi:hypothetical protein
MIFYEIVGPHIIKQESGANDPSLHDVQKDHKGFVKISTFVGPSLCLFQ